MIVNKYFYRKGGAETVMLLEREFLRETGNVVIDFSMKSSLNIASDYESEFVSEKSYYSNSILSNVSAAVSLIHSREAVRKIEKLIEDQRPDLVHIHNIYHQITPSIIPVIKKRNIPVVLTLHDYKTVCPTYTRLSPHGVCSLCLDGDPSHVLRLRCADGSLARSGLLLAEALFQRWLGSYEAVDRFIAPSEFMRASVSARFPPAKVALLYNGVHIDPAGPASVGDDRYVLYAGRLSKEKGIETLLAAHARSKGRWRLKIAGGGPLEPMLANHPEVERLGHLSAEETFAQISRASIVVVPSVWYENCPMSVLEAMSLGKPVIGSRIGGIPELIQDNVTGLLFEPGNAADLGDKIDSLMADPGRRAAMGMRAHERAVHEFSLEKHNDALMSIYASVLGDRRRSA